MKRYINRIGSLVISLSLLLAVPAYGVTPPVAPFHGSEMSRGSENVRQSVRANGQEVALEGPGADKAQNGAGALSGPGGASSPGGTAPTGTPQKPGSSQPMPPTPQPAQPSPAPSTGQPPQAPSTAQPPQAAHGPGLPPSQGTVASSGVLWDSGSVNGENPLVVNAVKQPQIRSQGGVLMDGATGEVIYSKNGSTRYYPASITKLMTALLVAESCNLNDTVTFSRSAVTNLESGAVTLDLAEGDRLTVEQCLYGLLLKSANEVANGLAEHVSGSVGAFANLMNEKAKSLGCTGTHFANPNGLNNPEHYTTPRDMALIGRAAFQNPTVAKVASTRTYQFPATIKAGPRTITMGHKMVNPNDYRYYPGIIGGKTGYTSLAGNTLVTCAQRDGRRYIAVVMKSKSTQYEDTKALLDYGFSLKSSHAPVNRWVEASAGTKWYFIKEDGKQAANMWMVIDGLTYWFNSDGVMATGWHHFSNGDWYYFKSGGRMAAGEWVESNGKWYYLGKNGVMEKNTVTPDGYRLNEDGVWVN